MYIMVILCLQNDVLYYCNSYCSNCYSYVCSQLYMLYSGIQIYILFFNSEELSFVFYMFDFVDRYVEKENLVDFIFKKREMFLVQV